jgi:hypothetical protein
LLGALGHELFGRYWQSKLESPDPQDRARAIVFLYSYYSDEQAESLLLAQAWDDDMMVRALCIEHLRKTYQARRIRNGGAGFARYQNEYEGRSRRAILLMLALSADQDEQIRAECFTTLGQINTNASLVVPQLIHRIPEEKSETARMALGWALEEYALHKEANFHAFAADLPLLIRYVNSSDPEVAKTAIGTLCRLGKAARQCLPDLYRKLRDKDLRRDVIVAISPLWELGPNPPELSQDSIQAITNFIQEDDDRLDDTIVDYAIGLLGTSGERSRDEIAILIECYDRQYTNQRGMKFAILDALVAIGDPGVLPWLRSVADTETDEIVAGRAHRALMDLTKRSDNGSEEKGSGVELAPDRRG